MKSASLMVLLYSVQPVQHYEMASNLCFRFISVQYCYGKGFFFFQTSFLFLRDFTSV